MGKKKSKKKIIITISVFIGITMAVVYCAALFAGNGKKEDYDALLREYPVSRGDITAGVDGAGTLVLEGAPQNFNTAVKLEEICVKQGDSVKKGDMIAKASKTDAEQQLHDLRIELQKAEIALENAKNDKKAGLLDSGTDGGAAAVRSEYDAQKTEAQTDANAIASGISAMEARVGEIDERLAGIDALLEGLPTPMASVSIEETEQATLETAGFLPVGISELELEKAALLEERTDIGEKLTAEYGMLSAANTAIGQIENAKKQKLDEINKQNSINKQRKAIEGEGLSNGIESAQIEVDEVTRKITQTEQLLKNLILIADRDGFVLGVNYTAGSITTEDQPVASVGEMGGLYARLQVGQSDIVDIQEGQAVELNFDAFPEMTIEGKVIKKMPVPIKDSNPVMYGVDVAVNLDGLELLPGMTCSAQFIIKQVKDVLMLSNKAIQMVGGKQVVLLKDETETLYSQHVKTGFSDGKFSEILSGLDDGQIVYVEG